MLVFQPCRFCGSPRQSRRCNFCRRATDQRARAKAYGVENTLTASEIYKAYMASNGICYYCKKPLVSKWTIDHIRPLIHGGGNTLENIVISCMTCNLEKGSHKVASFFILTKNMTFHMAFKSIVHQTIASMNGDWFSIRQFEEKVGTLFDGRPMDIRNFEFFLKSWVRKTEFERQVIHNPDDYNFECLYRVKSSKNKTEPLPSNTIKSLLPIPLRKRINKN